jgi:ribosomal 30S subunit maturation factor RimM
VARNAALAAKMKGMKAEVVKPQQRIGTVSKILTKVATDVEISKISIKKNYMLPFMS